MNDDVCRLLSIRTSVFETVRRSILFVQRGLQHIHQCANKKGLPSVFNREQAPTPIGKGLPTHLQL
jgi:hypothetical protein